VEYEQKIITEEDYIEMKELILKIKNTSIYKTFFDNNIKEKFNLYLINDSIIETLLKFEKEKKCKLGDYEFLYLYDLYDLYKDLKKKEREKCYNVIDLLNSTKTKVSWENYQKILNRFNVNEELIIDIQDKILKKSYLLKLNPSQQIEEKETSNINTMYSNEDDDEISNLTDYHMMMKIEYLSKKKRKIKKKLQTKIIKMEK
jgi:hypothetical protein